MSDFLRAGGVAKPSTVANSRKSRSSFSVEQVLYMERVFEQQKYLGSRDRQRIAEQLQMTEAQVGKINKDQKAQLISR